MLVFVTIFVCDGNIVVLVVLLLLVLDGGEATNVATLFVVVVSEVVPSLCLNNSVPVVTVVVVPC